MLGRFSVVYFINFFSFYKGHPIYQNDKEGWQSIPKESQYYYNNKEKYQNTLDYYYYPEYDYYYDELNSIYGPFESLYEPENVTEKQIIPTLKPNTNLKNSNSISKSSYVSADER